MIRVASSYKKLCCAVCGLFFVMLTFISIVGYREVVRCDVTDDDALAIGRTFANTFGIAVVSPPVILNEPTWAGLEQEKFSIKNLAQKCMLILGARTSQRFGLRKVVSKEISFGNVGMAVGCNNKEVIDYWKHELRPSGRAQEMKVKELQAKKIMEVFVSKLNMPDDMIFEKMDKSDNSWVGIWNRTHDGYKYYDNFIKIGIDITSGDLNSYTKSYWGTKCHIDVRITKDEALKIGMQKIGSWNRKADGVRTTGEYEVKRIGLFIVQPNAVFGFPTPLYRKDSRLAWTIIFNLQHKESGEHHSYDIAEIWIDAKTGEYLGGP